MFGQNVPKADEIAPTDLLNSYRNLVRKELGFGEKIPLDRYKAWFGYGNFENKNTNA